eukprot:TRINITY_DN771_c0_g1_i14.p1 TRINITY_DN771_c0_g1~~TRINITY_DN771_c0_g1_i14.p1  ORF type:complete len:240 (+),score=30.56 TRINITY_DN771_c0_g1_i14:578-1297(+)
MFPTFARKGFETEVAEPPNPPTETPSSQVVASVVKCEHNIVSEEKAKLNVYVEEVPARPSTVSSVILKPSRIIEHKEDDLKPIESSSQQKDIEVRPMITREFNRRIIICFSSQRRPTTSSHSKLTLAAFKNGKDWRNSVANPLDPQRPTSAGIEPLRGIPKKPERENTERPQTVFSEQVKSPIRVLSRPAFFRPVINQQLGLSRRQVEGSTRPASSVVKPIDFSKGVFKCGKKLTILDL